MNPTRTYSLKAMAAARVLAEITVLIVLVLAPLLIYFLAGKMFFSMHFIFKVLLCLLSPISLFVLFQLAKTNFFVSVNEECFSSRSLLEKKVLKWQEISSLKQVCRLGYREYLLSYAGGELSFPALLNRSQELVSFVRQHIVQGGRSKSGQEQTFNLATASFVFELLKLIFQCLFVILFFCFFADLTKSASISREDLFIVFMAAVLFAGALIWKTVQLARVPRKIELNESGLSLSGSFKTVSIAWDDISKLSPAGLFYPEGVIISAQGKRHLIGAYIDSFDELLLEIQSRRSIGPS